MMKEIDGAYMPTTADEWLELICDIAVGYDGCETVESLKELVNEMKEYAVNARKALNYD